MSTPLDKQLKKKRGKLIPIAGIAAEAAGVGATGTVSHVIPKDDVRRVKNQKYLVLSYATPDGTTVVRSPKGMVMKFSGAFLDFADAEDHAKHIRAEDPRFDVYVVELYKWGMVPLPKEEAPFVQRNHTDEMLTRIVSGLQTSMEEGRREIAERKMKDRERAMEEMRKTKGADYVMPEKSKLLEKYETEILKAREEEEKKAKEENRAKMIFHNEDDIMNVMIDFCVANSGAVIGAGTCSDFMKFFVEKSVARMAQIRRAEDRERQEDNPEYLPSHQEVREKLAEEGRVPISDQQAVTELAPPATAASASAPDAPQL